MMTGTITKVLYQKDNYWGRYEIDCTEKGVVCVGVIPMGAVGMKISFDGVYEDTKYGRQFSIKSISASEADEFAGIRKFLTEGFMKGIGEKKAAALINAFGKNTLDMFETEEGRAKIAALKGFSEERVNALYESYCEHREYKDIVVFLNGIGTQKQIEKIFRFYASQNPPLDPSKVIRENPYRLINDIDGFGFAKVDKLALASGLSPDSLERLKAAIHFVLSEAESTEGHCFLPFEAVQKRLLNLLAPLPTLSVEVKPETLEKMYEGWETNRDALIEKHKLNAEDVQKLNVCFGTRSSIIDSVFNAILYATDEGILVNSNGAIYNANMYACEEFVARTLATLSKENSVRFVTPELIDKVVAQVEERKTVENRSRGMGDFHATDEQLRAVRLGLTHRLSIISGGPGRGKTAICEIIAETFAKAGRYNNKNDIMMLAPTGRAAQRITESTGYPAYTIHRVISSRDPAITNTEGKLLIVDESSMIDIRLMAKLLSFARNCNIIFVGDVDQIASVGPGKVLKDMIASNVIPFILLTQGHRNTGSIAKNAELINAGEKLNNYVYDEHFKYVACDINNIQERIISTYKEKVAQYGITNVMLCTAMRQRGPLAVNALNQLLQAEMTKDRKSVRHNSLFFREGDRVMHTKNDYDMVKCLSNGEEVEGIFNGDRGTVQSISYKKTPDEEYVLDKLTVLFDDGGTADYTVDVLDELTLAYATTLHKCQGSEAPCMIMGYVMGDYLLLKRSLFYTGETRAKKEFIFLGEEKKGQFGWYSAFDLAVKNTDDSERNTTLSERLSEI